MTNVQCITLFYPLNIVNNTLKRHGVVNKINGLVNTWYARHSDSGKANVYDITEKLVFTG